MVQRSVVSSGWHGEFKHFLNGRWTEVDASSLSGKPQYVHLNDQTKHLYYWPSSKKWIIGGHPPQLIRRVPDVSNPIGRVVQSLQRLPGSGKNLNRVPCHNCIS